MRADIVVRQVVRVVGRDERNAGLGGHVVNLRHHDLVLVQSVVLHLEEEVAPAEHVGVLKRIRFGSDIVFPV